MNEDLRFCCGQTARLKGIRKGYTDDREHTDQPDCEMGRRKKAVIS